MKRLPVLIVCAVLFFSCNNESKTPESADAKTISDSAVAPKDYEFGDNKYVEIAKSGMADFASGNIDTWIEKFADNAVYRWNNFDSVYGKKAIGDYWKKRRSEVLDSVSYSRDIWMTIKVNKPQAEGQLTGNYALSWQWLKAKYKTGKSVSERIHTVYHFDANDKIDLVSSYLDRAPINAAMAK